MITINGRTFAKNNSEFINSLFNARGTCSGYYKRTKRTIKLYNIQNVLFACAINNRHNEKFIVSAYMDNETIRYMFALTTADKRYLGFDKVSWIKQHDIANKLFQ